MGQPKIQRNKKLREDKWKWEHSGPKSLGCSKSNSNTEVHSNTSQPEEGEKKVSNNLNLRLKEVEKE